MANLIIIALNRPYKTFAIPDALNKFIKAYNEVNWIEVGRRALWDYARKIERMEKIISNHDSKENDTKQ
jgi:hypothetical protein